jgi:hypothetical protein
MEQYRRSVPDTVRRRRASRVPGSVAPRLLTVRVSAGALRANAYGGVYDYGSRRSDRYQLQWRWDHDPPETLVQSSNGDRHLPHGRRRRHSNRRRDASGCHYTTRNATCCGAAAAKAAEGSADAAAAAILPRWLGSFPFSRLLLPTPGPAKRAIEKRLPDNPLGFAVLQAQNAVAPAGVVPNGKRTSASASRARRNSLPCYRVARRSNAKMLCGLFQQFARWSTAQPRRRATAQ